LPLISGSLRFGGKWDQPHHVKNASANHTLLSSSPKLRNHYQNHERGSTERKKPICKKSREWIEGESPFIHLAVDGNGLETTG
jgi:hypothetical protein